MANRVTDVTQQVQSSISDNRLNLKGNAADYDRLSQEHAFLGQTAQVNNERHMAIAKYFSSGAEQQRQQGKQFLNSGNIKMTLGYGLVAAGAAISVIPFLGPAMGIPMMAKGAMQIGLGTIDKSHGNSLMALADQALEEATKHDILGKDEAKIARRERNRSKLFERKLQLLRQMLNELGIDNEDLTEEQLEQVKAAFAANFDQHFEDASLTLANGGIMQINGLVDENGEEMGTQLFIRNKEDNEFYSVEVPRDENGDPILGATGRPLIDLERGITIVEDGEVKDLLELKFRFVDELTRMANELTHTDYNDIGDQIAVPYDTSDPEHMKELHDLVVKTNIQKIKDGSIAAPLRFVDHGGEPAFQRVEWDLETYDIDKANPIGIPILISELEGGTFDRSDMNSYMTGIQRNSDGLAELGMMPGGQISQVVGVVGNDSRIFGNNNITDTGASATAASISAASQRGSPSFNEFLGIDDAIDQIDSAIESNILDSQTGDDVGNGAA